MKVKLSNVRLAFPNLFEAKTVGTGEGEARFSAAFPIIPNSANDKAIQAAIAEVAKEKWKDKATAVIKELRSKGRTCYRLEELSKDGVVYDGFEGTYALNASNTVRPTVLDVNKAPLTAQDGRPYAGCYCTVIVDLWAQDNSWGRRINATLAGVQFFRDGEAFGGGRPASQDDFDDLSDTAEDEELA
jgi:hypothetical protein